MPRLTRLFPALALAALALSACDRDKSAADADASVQQKDYVPPQLTPAESTAAVAAQKAHSDSITRAVMGPDYQPPTEVYVDTPEKQYASCMAQARSADEPLRGTILKACERFRNPPPKREP